MEKKPEEDRPYNPDIVPGKPHTVSREVGGPGITGSPGVSEGGPTDPEATRQEEKEATEEYPGPAHGRRGDLGDSGPGED